MGFGSFLRSVLTKPHEIEEPWKVPHRFPDSVKPFVREWLEFKCLPPSILDQITRFVDRETAVRSGFLNVHLPFLPRLS